MKNEYKCRVQEMSGSEASSAQESGSSQESGAAEEGGSSSQWAARRAASSVAYQAARKEAQRQAYQKAKERRAKDPRYLQMKEAAKARRREHYQRVKQHRKAAQTAVKAARSVERASTESAERAFYKKGRVRLGQAVGTLDLAATVSALSTNAIVANDVS